MDAIRGRLVQCIGGRLASNRSHVPNVSPCQTQKCPCFLGLLSDRSDFPAAPDSDLDLSTAIAVLDCGDDVTRHTFSEAKNHPVMTGPGSVHDNHNLVKASRFPRVMRDRHSATTIDMDNRSHCQTQPNTRPAPIVVSLVHLLVGTRTRLVVM